MDVIFLSWSFFFLLQNRDAFTGRGWQREAGIQHTVFFQLLLDIYRGRHMLEENYLHHKDGPCLFEHVLYV